MTLVGKPHSVKPDLDNLLKWVCDTGSGVLWKDDSQISKFLAVEKIWGSEDKTCIYFEEII